MSNYSNYINKAKTYFAGVSTRHFRGHEDKVVANTLDGNLGQEL